MSEDKQPEEIAEAESTEPVRQQLAADTENLSAPVRTQENQVRLFGLSGINWGPVSAVTLAICIVVTMWVFDLSLLDPAVEQDMVAADEALAPQDFDGSLNDGELGMSDEQDFYAWLDAELSVVAEGLPPEQRQRARERIQNMDREQREKMRARWEGMSPAERAVAQKRLQERLPPAQDSAGE